MKSLTLFGIFFLSVHFLFCQPQFLNPQPSGFHNRKIVFTDEQTGFILNYNGDLIKTVNQGNTWEVAQNFYQANAFDAKDSVVVISGVSGVFISSDNGSTWQKSSLVFLGGFTDVDIVNRDTIFMIGQTSFFKSVDRGKTWQISNLGNVYLSCFDFIDSKIGFVGRTNTSMLKTLDGGQTWQTMLNQSTSSSYFYSVKFVNRDIAYAWKEYDSLYKTTDRGISWSRYTISRRINGMSFPNNTDGYLVGEAGVVWTTRDAGANWLPGTYPEDGFNKLLYSVYFISPNIGFTVGLNGLISKTVDGGLTWQRNGITMNLVKAMSFPNYNVGFVGSGVNAYKTTNGAKTWIKLDGMLQASSNNSQYEHAHFFNEDSGYFTASFPARVFITKNGGTSWRGIQFFANQFGTQYEGCPVMQVVNDSTIFMLLTHSVWGFGLYRSNDQGENWNKIDSTRPGGTSFYNFFFLDEKIGYAIKGYELLKTIDSAKTWTTLRYNNNAINKVYFLNEAEGFITDYEGIKRTSDSGKTWSSLEVEGSYYGSAPTSLMFANNALGYFTTNNGRILKTLDSGRSWQLFGNTGSDLSMMVKGGKDGLYAAGSNGVITYLPADTSWGTTSACHGSDFIFIADSGVSTYAHQWQVNKDSVFKDITDDGIYSGTNSYKLTVHNVPATWTNYQYRCKLFSGYSKVYHYRFKAEWTGAVDNIWENNANWSCGVVPDKNTDVVISTGSVIVNQTTTIRSLQISSAVSVILQPGVALNILN